MSINRQCNNNYDVSVWMWLCFRLIAIPRTSSEACWWVGMCANECVGMVSSAALDLFTAHMSCVVRCGGKCLVMDVRGQEICGRTMLEPFSLACGFCCFAGTRWISAAITICTHSRSPKDVDLWHEDTGTNCHGRTRSVV